MDELKIVKRIYAAGPQGPMGPQGPKGDRGDQGPLGVQGEQGIQGPAGATGPKGEKGDKGEQGILGPKGDKGDRGPRGLPGPRGEKGEPGEIGGIGSRGPKGDPFTYEDFTAAQLEALRGPQGLLGILGIQGIQGEQGPAGQDGRDGADGQDGAPGLDGHTPVITASKSNGVTTIFVDGTTIATINDGLDGQNGQDGQNGADGTNGTNGTDGITPHIDSTTKHWMIGETDTGVVAEGLNVADQVTQSELEEVEKVTAAALTDINEKIYNLQVANEELAAVSITGSYNDLINKPTIPSEVTESTVSGWGFTKNTGTSTFSGSYNDLTDKPTIPLIWSGTQAQYTALSPNYDSNTIYIITAS